MGLHACDSVLEPLELTCPEVVMHAWISIYIKISMVTCNL